MRESSVLSQPGEAGQSGARYGATGHSKAPGEAGLIIIMLVCTLLQNHCIYQGR